MKKRKRAKHKDCFNCLKCDAFEIGKYIAKQNEQITNLTNKLEKAERARGGCEWCKKGQELCGTCKRFYGIPPAADEDGRCSAPATEVKCVGYVAIGFCPMCGAEMMGAYNDE